MQIFCVESNRVIGRLVDAVHTVRSCYSNLFQRFYVGFYNDVEFGSFSVGYLHGLFDSDDFTRALVNGLRERKGLAPLDSTFHYAQYKSQQFDLLADAMRQHIDIEKIYTIMQQHREPV